jgi:hypothetical protein
MRHSVKSRHDDHRRRLARPWDEKGVDQQLESPDDAGPEARWRNDERRLRAEISRATGYAGEFDDIDEPFVRTCAHHEPRAGLGMPPSIGPESDSWPGDDDDEDKDACPSELRPGTGRQIWWTTLWG